MKSDRTDIVACQNGHAWPANGEVSACPVCGRSFDPSVSLSPVPPGYLAAALWAVAFLVVVVAALPFIVLWGRSTTLDHQSNWLAITLAKDGHLWTGGHDQVVKEWSCETGKEIGRSNIGFPVDYLAVSSNGERFLLVSEKRKPNGIATSAIVQCFDPKNRRVLWETTSTNYPSYPKFVSNDQYVCWKETNRVVVADAESGHIVKEFHPPQSDYIAAYAITEDREKCAFVTESYGGKSLPVLTLHDANDPSHERTIHPLSDKQPVSKVQSLAFSDDGKLLAIAGGRNYIRGEAATIDFETGNPLSPIYESKADLRAVSWTDRANELVLIDDTGTIYQARFNSDKWEVDVVHQSNISPLRFELANDARTWATSRLGMTQWGTADQVHTLHHASPEKLDPLLFVLLIVPALLPMLIALPFVLILRGRMATSRQRLLEVASRLNLVYCRQTTQLMFDRLRQCSLFRLGSRRWYHDVLQGTLNGHEAIAGRLTTEVHNGRNRSLLSHHALIFPDAGADLPQFKLTPEGLLTRLIDAVTGADINFDHSQRAAEFSRQFELKGSEPDTLRKLFDDRLIELLVDSKGWTIRNDGGHLVFERSLRAQSWRHFFTEDEDAVDVDFMTESWRTAGQLVDEFQSRAER